MSLGDNFLSIKNHSHPILQNEQRGFLFTIALDFNQGIKVCASVIGFSHISFDLNQIF
jgi:hypothetical protein